MTSPNPKVLQWFREYMPDELRAGIRAGVLVVWKQYHPPKTNGRRKKRYFTVHFIQLADETARIPTPNWFTGRQQCEFETQPDAKRAAERWYKEMFPFDYLSRVVDASTPVPVKKLKPRKQYGI